MAEEKGLPQLYLTYSGTLTKNMTDYISGSMILTDTDGTDTNDKDIIYNLQGIRMKDITAPGIYIVNGKKILMR